MKRYKDYKTRIHNWQLNPVKYEYPGGKHRCDCCGEEHEGNFCPLCGQKASHGPITWKSVWAGIMEIWGMHSRSLPYTAWQLLTRPGHLMRDYITGKRQVSFPPVKMLVILGVIVYLIGHWLNPQTYTHEIGNIVSTGILYYIKYALKWLSVHHEWFSLVGCSLFILPTWWLFRYAPLIKRHTLPQGFFIQVFLVNQLLLVDLLLFLLLIVFPDIPLIESSLLLLFFWIVDYKQLFGYSWWGTIWRWLMMFVLILVFIFTIGVFANFVMALVVPNSYPSVAKHGTIAILGKFTSSVVAFGCLMYALVYSVNTINRKTWLERGKWKAWRVPIILIALVFILSFVTSAI